MGVPMLKKCCCCVSLQTGTLIIGYLYTIWALAELTGMCLLVTLAPLGAGAGGGGGGGGGGVGGRVTTHKYGFYIAGAAVSCVHLLCSALLLIGAYKRLASLTLPWTIVTGVLTAVFFVLSLTAVSLVLQDSGDLLRVEVVFIFVHLTRACISVYCIMVVHSRHKEIMNEKAERAYQHSGRVYKPVTLDENVL